MFNSKVKRGGELIKDGMAMLTQATNSIEQGIKDNGVDIDMNQAKIDNLLATNRGLLDENNIHQNIVTNFNKNILGIED